jgi:hypothetical protein
VVAQTRQGFFGHDDLLSLSLKLAFRFIHSTYFMGSTLILSFTAVRILGSLFLLTSHLLNEILDRNKLSTEAKTKTIRHETKCTPTYPPSSPLRSRPPGTRPLSPSASSKSGPPGNTVRRPTAHPTGQPPRPLRWLPIPPLSPSPSPSSTT